MKISEAKQNLQEKKENLKQERKFPQKQQKIWGGKKKFAEKK